MYNSKPNYVIFWKGKKKTQIPKFKSEEIKFQYSINFFRQNFFFVPYKSMNFEI